MRSLLAFLVALFTTLAAMTATPALARTTVVVVEDWAAADMQSLTAERFVVPPPAALSAPVMATYGPFRVVDGQRAQLVGITDERSPRQFSAMLRDFPELEVLELVDVAGTYDDRANLRLARMIRSAGLTTHVPQGGSVRSGGVELFVAGAQRWVDDGAEFAVHAWQDEAGYQATDFAIEAPENRKYLEFYREMGMSEQEARGFYAMTNSVPFENARWLDAIEMRGWVDTDPHFLVPAQPRMLQEMPTIRLAYLDLGLAFF